jgi:NTE family protein
MSARRHAGARDGSASALAALAALLVLSPGGASAQGPGDGAAPRPRVCLVLAGGGARGAAHIGVIKVLEQLRVPVDCIAGTSMGALVGAAYATGMSAGQMEGIVAGLSSEALFVDRPPREDLPMRAKIDERRNFIGPELGVRAGHLQAQKGIVAGVRLETLLRRLIRFSDVVRFDELPIPFRAVATDLAGGEPVELAQGQLSEVVRASLSVPVALTPALIDGRVLVDGALTDNLPVDVARRMGADVAIVVDLGSPRVTREELGTYYGLTRQIINILIAQNERQSRQLLRPGDIVIHPELGDFSGADFDHWAMPIPAGEAAAWQLRDRLAALSLPPQAYEEWDRRRRSGPAPSARAIDEIRLPAMRRVDPGSIQDGVHSRTGEPLDADRLEADLRRLYAGGDFERVGYGLLDEDGRRVLRIDAVEKSWGPNFLRLGLEGGADLRGESRFELIGSLRRTWVDSLGAEWRNEFELGYDQRLSTELYQPLDQARVLFVAPYADLQRHALDIFADDQRQARYIVYDARSGVDLGARIGRAGELRAGLLVGRVRPAPGPGAGAAVAGTGARA